VKSTFISKPKVCNTRKTRILSTLAALSFVLGGCSESNEIKTIKITSNPDNIEIVGLVYAVTDARLAAIDFTRFMKSEQVGENILRSDPQKLRGYESISNAIALVVERKIQDGAKLTKADYSASLTGVKIVPEEYKSDFGKNGYYSDNARAFDITITAVLMDRQGQGIEWMVGKGGTIKFLWFLPKETRSCELVIESAKPLTLEIPKID